MLYFGYLMHIIKNIYTFVYSESKLRYLKEIKLIFNVTNFFK